MIVGGVFLVVMAAAVISFEVGHGKQQDGDRALSTLHRFCADTKAAMHDDWLMFKSNDEKLRDLAYQRFYEGTAMYHNAASARICTEDVPPLPKACWLSRDWRCLAALAKDIEEKL